MLLSLNIKNVVLISHLVIEFKGGLCVLTGETGAGKSVLLDSLGLALGVRAESGLVRQGEESASVTAAFQLSDDHGAIDLLNNADIEFEDDVLLLRRIVSANGKSRAFINDQPVSVSLLKSVGDTLVEIHGQFETQGLLNPATHRGMLDEYAGIIERDLTKVWDAWKTEEQAFHDMKNLSARAREEEEYIRLSLEDLSRLEPMAGEENELSSLRERLKHRDVVLQGLHAAAGHLGAEFDPVQSAWAELDKIADKIGDDAQSAIDALSRASNDIAEASSIIQSVSANMQEGDYDLEEIDDRLYALRLQARKHKCDVDDLAKVADDLSHQLSLIDHTDERLEQQRHKVEKARAAYIKNAEKIRNKRQKVATKLNALVQKELAPLKLDKARFVTDIESLDEVEWGANGMARVRFMVSTNPGRAPGPIHKIASGGEMSRFMLALKVIIAQAGSTHSFIFDEVDTGIGGATAAAVGDRLARLADLKQVLVVTHAPQVAARADSHWIVKKGGNKNIQTDILPLETRQKRCEEIARMLAGADITDEARAAANKLLDAA